MPRALALTIVSSLARRVPWLCLLRLPAPLMTLLPMNQS